MKIQAYSVTDIISEIKQTLERTFRASVIIGEISNLSSSAAGIGILLYLMGKVQSRVPYLKWMR